MHGLITEGLSLEFGLVPFSLVKPGKDGGKRVVVSEGFAVRCLVLDPEMSAARLLTGQGVKAH
jgi:hypothetical protein